jgi:hypothetical protein
MNVRFFESSAGNPDKTTIILQLFDAPATGVPHTGTKSAEKLVNIG